MGRNEGFKESENLDLVLYQWERHAKNSYKDIENEYKQNIVSSATQAEELLIATFCKKS